LAGATRRKRHWRWGWSITFYRIKSLKKYTDGVLQTLAENAPLSIANTKTMLEEYAKSVGAPDHARMRAAMERCARSEDYAEGRRAFMEKRKPRFRGS
jgi:enoyl-CoA hydratase